MSKKNGSYYTPSTLANFIAEYMREKLSACTSLQLRILEPSCGDGVFLEALSRHFEDMQICVDALDLDIKAISRTADLVNSLTGQFTVQHADYLDWCKDNGKTYDLIIGNPPYITKKLLSAEQKQRCTDIHSKNPDFGNEIHNLWTSFLCDGISRISPNGALAFVLPAELLKVKFGERIQKSLLKQFQRIEIFTFSTNVFPNIEQDTIILFLFKESSIPGLYFTTINSSICLIKRKFTLKRKRSLEAMKLKWSAYPLLENQIKSVSKFKKALPSLSNFCDTIPGIVTAANDYFIASKSVVEEFELESVSSPIIQKGSFVNGCVTLSKEKFHTLVSGDKPAFFLDLSKTDPNNKKHQEYISFGAQQEIDKRYKCKLRNKWYEVPGAWVSEGFFFKRCHEYPKFLYNDAEALVTDASYRVKMKDQYNIRSLIFSFYNSLTLAFAEIQGRYYGGGVLELTPSEFKSLPVPYVPISEDEFNEFVEVFHNKKSIDDILSQNDEKLLVGHLGLSDREIASLKQVRETLLARRLSISKSQFN